MTAQWPSELMNSYKSNVPVIPLEERMEMLKALRCVDIVRPYHELEYVSGCKELKPDIFVIGVKKVPLILSRKSIKPCFIILILFS